MAFPLAARRKDWLGFAAAEKGKRRMGLESHMRSPRHPGGAFAAGFGRAGRAAAAALAVLLALGASGCRERGEEWMISGRVEMDTAYVGSKVGGRVIKVSAEEGQPAQAGDVLVELDREELEAQWAQARAAAAQAQAQLDLLLAGARAEDLRRAEAAAQARRAELQLRREGFREEEIREAEAQVESARSREALARKELARAEDLFARGVIEARTLDQRRSEAETAQAGLEAARERAALARSGSRPAEIAMAEAALAQAEAELERLRNGARPEEIAAQRAALEAARAQAAYVQIQIAETRITAPAAATVETLDLHPGDLVRAGQAVAALQLNHAPWIRCYAPENRLGWIRPGDPVRVRVDSWPDVEFEGVVRRVSAEAEFTPRNVQTQEKRAELVFEVKVDITKNGERLRPGMFADVIFPASSRTRP